jgi:hypothetical protein
LAIVQEILPANKIPRVVGNVVGASTLETVDVPRGIIEKHGSLGRVPLPEYIGIIRRTARLS